MRRIGKLMVGRSKSSLASALSVAMADHGVESPTSLKVGFLAPLTGKLKSWAEPGLNGSLIWRDRVNASGGIRVGMRRYMVDLVPFDTRFQPELALAGVKKLIDEDDVKFILMVGGNDFTEQVRNVINRHRMLVATLLPSDLTPDAPTLIAPSEVHPIYNVTGVDWLKRQDPTLKTVAMCAQDDLHGLPSIATYRAAFEAADIELVAEHLFPIETTDFGAIVDGLLAKSPDVLCWDTAYEPFLHALTKEAYKRGFKGRLLSCTCDNYQDLIDQTSPEFMEGFVFQFPDFDDPRLNDSQVNFENANAFYEEFCERFPHSWSAVSWEYASTLELWKNAVQRARSTEPFSVLSMMKFGGVGHHAFGEAIWWGNELFGIDNALVGDWPVVMIENGRARIQEFSSIMDWWNRHKDALIRHMRAMNLMWDQRESSRYVRGLEKEPFMRPH
jgi:branched-chain amino acid transport system substrate-binding protein